MNRTTKKLAGRGSALTTLCAVGVLTMSGIAVADDISNNLDTSIDTVAEVMALNVGGANGTTQLYVTPRNGDSKNGCNLTGSTELKLDLSSNNTAVATVSPSSVTFSSCSDTKTLTVTPVAQGSASVSATQASNTTDATFNLAPATFTVNVAPPANTAPEVSVAGVTGGASYNKGAVPAALCQVTDAEDGNKSFAADLSAVAGDYASDGIGSQTASCSYTDKGGLTASASETYSIVDPSAPEISSTVDGDLGMNGWYTSDVSLDWSVLEPESPNSLQKTGCVDQTITADQGETAYSCSATSAGGTAAEQIVKIKRDATAPTVTAGAVSGTVGSNGWYTSDATVKFNGSDATSGLLGDATVSRTTSGEGEAVTVSSPAFTDNAGNVTAAGEASKSFKIDKAGPTFDLTGGVQDGGVYDFDYVPAAPNVANAADAVSGVNGSATSVTGYNAGVGTHTVTAKVVDNAGNVTEKKLSYQVKAWRTNGFFSPVDMGGVYNTAKAGSTIPLKFELFAGNTELTDVAAVKSFSFISTTAPAGAAADEIENFTSGSTSLRYDATAGQFIQNWKTPAAGSYKVTMTAKDGTAVVAYFTLRK